MEESTQFVSIKYQGKYNSKREQHDSLIAFACNDSTSRGSTGVCQKLLLDNEDVTKGRRRRYVVNHCFHLQFKYKNLFEYPVYNWFHFVGSIKIEIYYLKLQSPVWEPKVSMKQPPVFNSQAEDSSPSTHPDQFSALARIVESLYTPFPQCHAMPCCKTTPLG